MSVYAIFTGYFARNIRANKIWYKYSGWWKKFERKIFEKYTDRAGKHFSIFYNIFYIFRLIFKIISDFVYTIFVVKLFYLSILEYKEWDNSRIDFSSWVHIGTCFHGLRGKNRLFLSRDSIILHTQKKFQPSRWRNSPVHIVGGIERLTQEICKCRQLPVATRLHDSPALSPNFIQVPRL